MKTYTTIGGVNGELRKVGTYSPRWLNELITHMGI